MKKNLFILFIHSSLVVVAQKNSIDVKFAPTLTAIGKPVGDKVSQQIDKDGGKIFSSDKQVELIIPQDAVSKKTDISIQSVENTLSPGNGNSYRLEPSGITFQKPLQIIFHYSEKEGVAMPELRNIAWQDNKGQWYRLDSCIVDTINRTVTGNITHFSTWMFFDAFRIDPSSAKLKVNKTIHPEIVCTGIPLGSGGKGFTNETIPPKMQFSTYVNGIPGGDDVVGKVGDVVDVADHYILGYYAPASVPAKNPVAVSVETNANFTLYGKKYNKLKLVSNIEIWDGWHYTFIGYSSKGCFRMIDSSSCDIRVEGNKVIVSNIINYKAWSDWPQCDKGCTTEYTNKDSWKGLVEIWGVAGANFTGATENSPAKIYITLIPAIGNTPGAKVTCPKDTRNIPSMPMPAQPNYISFDITGPDEVLIHYGGKSSNVVLYNVVKGDGFVINMSN